MKRMKGWGGLDVLLIGTGIWEEGDTLIPIKGRSLEDVKAHYRKFSRKTMFVNQTLVRAAFQAAATLGTKNIFTIGSVHGSYPRNDGVAAYSVSKADNSALARLYPTPWTKREGAMGISMEGDYILSQMTAKYVMAVLKGTQLGFVMTPKQVAEAALWLIAFHDHKQLGYMKDHRKKPGMKVPDLDSARKNKIHEVAVPGNASVQAIKKELGLLKEDPSKAESDQPKVIHLESGKEVILSIPGTELRIRLSSPSLVGVAI